MSNYDPRKLNEEVIFEESPFTQQGLQVLSQ